MYRVAEGAALVRAPRVRMGGDRGSRQSENKGAQQKGGEPSEPTIRHILPFAANKRLI